MRTVYKRVQSKIMSTLSPSRPIISGKHSILLHKFGVSDSNGKIYVNNPNFTPTVTLPSPLSMGDPHITTIRGRKYWIPNVETEVTLYKNSELTLSGSLRKHPHNQKNPIYRDLTFISQIQLKLHETSTPTPTLVVDCFNPDHYYQLIDDTLVPLESNSCFTLIKNQTPPECLEFETKCRKENQNCQFRYISFESKTLGKTYIQFGRFYPPSPI